MKNTLISAMAAASLFTMVAAAEPRSIPAGGGTRALGRAGSQSTPRATDRSKSSERNLLVYVLTVGFPTAQFGVVDLGSGAFLPIGPGLPSDVGAGLVPGRGKSLLTLAGRGNLVAIDPVTGATTVIGPTGLRDCAAIGIYDPLCPNFIGRVDGTVYVTDFAQNLYSVDERTGAATLIGPTGIPPLTFAPFTEDQNGSVDVYAESLFSYRGKLYALFSTSAVNFETGGFTSLMPAYIYQIDPRTGQTTRIGPTDSRVSTIVNVNDTLYGFNAVTGQVEIIDLTTGQTTPVSNVDAGVIAGATPARPVPAVVH